MKEFQNKKCLEFKNKKIFFTFCLRREKIKWLHFVQKNNILFVFYTKHHYFCKNHLENDSVQ